MGRSNLAYKSQSVTAEEYLKLERNSKRKHEFFDGEIVAMAGASLKHNIISSNLQGELFSQLKGSPCRPFASDLRVKAKRNYFYPDIVVSCQDRKFEDDSDDTLLNPRIIIEILSKSTKLTDRNLKFDSYLSIETLTDYILVEQNSMRVEHYQRNKDVWNVVVLSNPSDKLFLNSINCELNLAEIYNEVKLSK
ncbi:MAG: Uma2 family endonuclease [Pyrinomonadaceae bacterium]|nr:Uma2 family endonuclease [Pyrinomonadaceae bacterium]